MQIEVTEELIGLTEWLDDWIVTPQVRIRDLIHEVGSKDGAHTDDVAGRAMNALEANQVLVSGGLRMDTVRPVIIGLGEYVARRVRELLDRR